MNETPQNALDGCAINVSSDRMSVTLKITATASASATDVIARLKGMKISRFDDGLIIEAMLHRNGKELSIEVASGVAPVNDRPEGVKFSVPVSDVASGLITKVTAGQIIAEVTPGVVGTDGCDVLGEVIERRKVEPSLVIGRNASLVKGKVMSQMQGGLRLAGNVLSVEPLLEIRGDDGNGAPIIFDGDAVIRGSLNKGRVAQITGCLTVGGAIEGVQLKSGGSVVALGGIIGNQWGKYVIGGDLHCRFISCGSIVVGQDIHVQSNVTDSHIACAGRVVVTAGVIVGGVLAANSGLSCCILGNPAGTPTLIEAGAGVSSRAFLDSVNSQIESNHQRIRAIRAKITPLLKIMKSLTAQQREKATELLYEADELEATTRKLIADMEIQTRNLTEKSLAQVVVAKIIYQGVTIRFNNVMTVISTAIKGPLTLLPRQMGGVTQIRLIDGTDQSEIGLPTQPINAPHLARHAGAEAA